MEPGLISNQVIRYIIESPLVIADLTGGNANVFYELAVWHDTSKPVVQMINLEEQQQMPFDIAGTRTIKFNIKVIRSVEKSKNELEEQIKNIEAGKNDIDNPISMARNTIKQKQTEHEIQSTTIGLKNLTEILLKQGIIPDKSVVKI